MRAALTLVTLLATSALAAAPSPYKRSVDLVDHLYFYPHLVHEGTLLHASVDELSRDLHWLMVEKPDDSSVVLKHGSGRVLGQVRVDAMQEVPGALEAVESLVLQSEFSVGDVDVPLSLLTGLGGAMDRYSRVLSGDALDRFDQRLKGTIVGIGCNLRMIDDEAQITRVHPGGPADRAGLAPGDRLTAIDGVSTLNMPLGEVTRRIRGETGSEVVLDVLRDDKALRLAMNRAVVVIPNVVHEVLEDEVGYIRIDHFSQRTTQNLRKALAALGDAGALQKGLVLDLRGNTGGSLRHSAQTADLFLREGLLVRTAGPDGQAVRNLQASMEAHDDGTEPDIPLFILTDRRTASGSEIVAGALVEHEHAVLVGRRTYGKGSVQKLYGLANGVSLKMTVAEYLLENDRRIAHSGLAADAVVGAISLGERGASWGRGWNTQRERTEESLIIPEVRETTAWRGEEHRPDVVLELARRAVLLTEGSGRDASLRALEIVSGEMQTEQLSVLEAALDARDIDWSTPAIHPETEPTVDLSLVARPGDEDQLWLEVTAHNRGPHALGRVMVELECPGYSAWNGLRIPVGRIEAGDTATGSLRRDFKPGVFPREDEATLLVKSWGYEPVIAGNAMLRVESSPKPALTVHARMLEGDGDSVEVVLDNPTEVPVTDLDVYFRAPGDLDVTLIDRAVRLDELGARDAASISLRVALGEDTPGDRIPLLLVAENERYGELLQVELPLPRDGRRLRIQPPTVHPRNPPLSAPVGPMTLAWDSADDVQVEHAVVWVNGEKTQWVEGGSPKLSFRTPMELTPGANHVVVIVTDSQGQPTRRHVVIRGEAGEDAQVDNAP